MSEYKIKIGGRGSTVGSERSEVVDLVDDWNYTEEEAERLWHSIHDEDTTQEDTEMLNAVAMETTGIEFWWGVHE